MNHTYFAQGITADNLRTLLTFWPRLSAEFEGLTKLVVKDKELLFEENAIQFSWCHLYELPVRQHMTFLLSGFSQDKQFLGILKNIVESPSQIGALPVTAQKIEEHLDSMGEPTEEEVTDALPLLASVLVISLSAYNSLRCVLYHGCFLNDLILRISSGDDKALFDAVRIDPTVIGCKAALARISQATLVRDVKFFSKLKAALTGKIAKREQANFQKMRLVLEVLHEAGADRLSDSILHELFVKELMLYSGNAKSGGNAKALRKFADTYMKKNIST